MQLLFFGTVAAQSLPIAWGFATSAYQIEGAWNVDGKSPSVWDTWYNDPIRAGNPNAFTANDHYHRMPADIAYLGKLGATAYRFSVSWSRILPQCSGAVNPLGIAFYNNMINEIIANGAIPILTMYHWDTPQACHDQYNSWTSEKIVADFTNYGDVLFKNFGDRVKYFLTLNEPSAECGFGYGQKFWPPGMNGGDALRYQCVHWTNLAHGSVVQLARKKYAALNLKFGMPIIIAYGEPLNNTDPNDIAAANRMMDIQVQWNWGPLTTGDYPAILKTDPSIGPLLPVYTAAQKLIMANTMDFCSVNYYSSSYVKNSPGTYPGNYVGSGSKNGVPLGPISGTDWQTVYAPGLRGLLKFVAATFPTIEIIVSECGVSVPNEQSMTLPEIVDDTFRQSFWVGHLLALTQSITIDKTPVKAFLAWSLFDNFEWNTYDQRFGSIAIDYAGGTLNRTIKNSALYLSGQLKSSVSPFTLPKVSTSVPGTGTGSNSGSTTGSSALSYSGFGVFWALVYVVLAVAYV